MKGTLAAAIVIVALLALPLAAVPAAGERTRPELDPTAYRPLVEVENGTSDRTPGLGWVRVRMGDVTLGVMWSTARAERKMGPTLAADYVRFFGGAELVDEQGNHLRTIGLPLHTVLIQHFGRMVEFRDGDNDGLFDLRVENRTTFGVDVPVKMLSLDTAWYLDGDVESEITNESASVTFTISADQIPYALVYDPGMRIWRPGAPADGALDRISLTFHLDASSEVRTASVPFYRIYLANGNEREPSRSEFIGNRTVTGRAVQVNGKYDQSIEGWDFGFADAKLALGTGLTFGNRYDRPIVQWLQRQFGGACLKDGTFAHCESEEGPAQPVVIARTQLQVAEEWQRAGEWYWVSGVTVDGRPDTMTFEIYWAERIEILREGRAFFGFRAHGAFVYPQGQTIVHDPGIGADSFLTTISEVTNLAPSFMVALQLGIVAVALVPAVLLRQRARKGRA